MTLKIVDKPINLAMKIMVLIVGSNGDAILPVRYQRKVDQVSIHWVAPKLKFPTVTCNLHPLKTQNCICPKLKYETKLKMKLEIDERNARSTELIHTPTYPNC
jgi:hypothetical protein